jgi:bifunctional DNA-binding transcriptional regulator/antitoxin component of YhaV-PrlF toxin-antitoxin module
LYFWRFIPKESREVILANEFVKKELFEMSSEKIFLTDLENKEKFKNLIESKVRSELSFGAELDAVDNFVKSVRFFSD